MSKNFGLKGGELDDSPRLGGWVTHQRAARLPENQAKAYLWLAQHGPATYVEAQHARHAAGISDLNFSPIGTDYLVYEGMTVRVRA